MDIDRFTKTHRLSAFQAAKRSAAIDARQDQNPMREGPGNPLPIEDTQFILKHGKAAYRRQKERP